MEPSRVLAALADLAPAGRERTLDVAKGDQPILFLRDPDRAPRNRAADRLAALDVLHRDERILRRGWAWLLGVADVDGAVKKLRVPLVAEPVRLERSGRGYKIVPAGDLELTPLLTDRERARTLEAAPGLGTAAWLGSIGTTAWVATAAEAAGFKPDRLADHSVPLATLPTDELVGQAVAALYVARDVSSAGLRDTLRAWSARAGLERTALAAVYGAGTAAGEHDEAVVSPLPLNRAQREVVRRTRHEPVVVVSGPPGNGKSHAVVAAALDTVHRGGSVLVATQSAHAAEVLGELLARYPGPEPVLFGNTEHRGRILATLTAGLPTGVTGQQLRADEAAVETARQAVDAIAAGIGAALDLERAAATMRTWEPLLAGLRAEAPKVFAKDFNPDKIRKIRFARKWRLRRLTGVDEDRLPRLLEARKADRAAATLAVNGGTDLEAAWDALDEADRRLADAVGTAMRHSATSGRRWGGDARRSTAALAAALRTGRNGRREALAALDGPALVEALPLWIGTVTDVEDLLPPTPGLFDLVILDEAAHIDQLRAAPVLARARRALVAGDPSQLRFVSFVADVDVAATLARHGLSERVDVRRSSAYDVAVGASPATWLDEHYRCAPHLIDFSARRFYQGRLHLMTRHPRTERLDAIDVVHVPDAEVTDGVNHREVEAILAAIAQLADRTGIGVVTPFRAQADAIEAALLKALPVEEIERLGLRTGTVHAFQGSEAATVIVSLGLVDGDSPARQRFAAEPNLFNVMVTRARERLVVVTSLTGGTGLVADYLAHAEGPRGSHDDPDAAVVPFVRRMATELAAAGHDVRTGYAVGAWTIDVVADGTGLICGPHPDGNAAHIERQRALLRAGWALHDAFPSRWGGDPVRAALDLSAQLRR
ncbi:AAA domain-containing protein [Dactylosporangium sp. NPDC005572]|uniref:AAA domain-containing protein n=1 Tax=Dactylosporangium sp. NPDC005572 TaxID=3156889 RepID=UPI0033A80C27